MKATTPTRLMHCPGRVVLIALGLVQALAGSITAAPQEALEHELVMEGWAEEVQPRIARIGGMAALAKFVDHDVLGFRLNYSTIYRGEKITVSGLVVYPIEFEQPAPILVWTHGTIFDERSGPSSWKSPALVQLMPAMHGMITFLPDYVGYGATADRVHPYILREDITPSVIDMIHAGRQFLQAEQIAFGPELYVMGFSEGGYVAMDTARELDTNPKHGIALTAAHAVSGPYDLHVTASLILNDPSYPTPAYMGFMMGAYNERYWNRDLGHFLNEPYDAAVTRFQSGDMRLGAMASSMPGTIGELLAPSFAADFKGDGELEYKRALQANDIPLWSPSMPLHIYHGTADRDVPFDVGKGYYEDMLAAGADATKLSFHAYEGANHSATVVKAVLAFLESN